MTSAERKQKIEAYGNAHKELSDVLKQFPQEVWNYKSSPDRWSIKEILVHLADSEANAFVRCRRLIAEPGKPVTVWDQNVWAKSLNYSNQNPEDALELLKWQRRTTYNILKTLPESTWSNTVTHPEHPHHGEYTLDKWLDIYSRHVQSHINQMQKNYQEWKKTQASK